MFTGLIETVGVVESIDRHSDGARLVVRTSLASSATVGESIAMNGVCLTVTHADERAIGAEISPETWRVTSFSSLQPGRRVNLERSLRMDARLGGHFVLGHVDGVGHVASIEPDGECYWLDVSMNRELADQMILKGSIAIDGISLTIARLTATSVGIQIVPFTWSHTALPDVRAGDAVNIETDVIGKYVARLLRGTHDTTAAFG